MNLVNRATSKTIWDWQNWAPASAFFRSLRARYSTGSAKGFSTHPTNSRGRPATGLPLRSRPCFSRRTVQISWTESRSNTPLACGWSPKRWWSPVRQSRLGTPRAAAPRISAWSAIRFRSRQPSCMTGSTPTSRHRRAAARGLIRTTAPCPSVTLTASTHPCNMRAFLLTSSASAPRGGPTSAVTTNPPLRSRAWRCPFGSSCLNVLGWLIGVIAGVAC